MKKVLLSFLLLFSAAQFSIFNLQFSIGVTASAQRQMETLDRGLVAVKVSRGVFLSWRLLGEEYYDVTYNVYRDGSKIASDLQATNYSDASGKTTSTYTVAPVVRGVEQEQSAAASVWAHDYLDVPMAPVQDRQGNDVTSDYEINDCCAADVDGDGVLELIVKRTTFVWSETVLNTMIEIYKLDGTRLWYIDIGPNLVSGPDGQFDAVAFDWDEDGRAEFLMRGADNMIIHKADGTTQNVGNMSVDTRNEVFWTANLAYTRVGAEYLLYLDGQTGEPYQIIDYPLPRVDVNQWGDNSGHRATKHYFGAPYLDGQHPSIFLGRGCYTQHKMVAFDVDPATHKLNQRWYWENTVGGPWWGQGYHNFGIADVDCDGRDEICFGSMCIDDNGKGLSTAGLGHGDAQHWADLDPYRHGHEVFACLEDNAGCNLRDATTSTIYRRVQAAKDDGRCMAGNFSNKYPGAIGVSTRSGGAISAVTGENFYPSDYDPAAGVALNFRLYWNGDLCEETFNYGGMDASGWMYGVNPGLSTGDDWTCIKYFTGCITCNSTKGSPCLTADMFGDWRDEVLLRTEDNKAIRIWTTTVPSKWRIYTQMHDPQYRNGVVWQTMGYNQPPHLGYFLGELEGYTVAPPPLMTNGRKEVANGGTIDASLNDQHVLIAGYTDSQIALADGAQPYILTVNSPSWVQGTASTNTTKKDTEIKYDYYTTTLSGHLTGTTRLVKQGDGILQLADGDHTHSGLTDIWAGTVKLNGGMPQSHVTMKRFAELEANGKFDKGIEMEYDARIYPGGDGQQGTIETSELTMRFGARLVIDLFADTKTADMLKATNLKLTTQNWELSPKYNRPVLEFRISNAEGGKDGRYLIAHVDKFYGGSINTFTVEGLESVKYSLEAENGDIYLVISSMRGAADIVWTGAESNVWDMGTSNNFSLGGQSDHFVSGDNVLINDESTSTTITLDGTLLPASVTFDVSRNITLNGEGSIGGDARLVKKGSGTVTVQNMNSYTGGTTVSGGTLRVLQMADKDHVEGSIGGVDTPITLEHGGTLAITNAVNCEKDITIGEGGGTIAPAANFEMTGRFTGGTLTKKGGGTLSLITNCPIDSVIVAGGELVRFESSHPVKDVIVLKSGKLSDWNNYRSYSVYDGHIHIDEGANVTWNLDGRGIYFGKLTGCGTVTCSGYDRSDMACDFTDFTGTFKPKDYCRLCTDKGMPEGTLDLSNDIWVSNLGKTFEIGKLVGKGALGGITGAADARAGAAGSANTWIVGNDKNWTWAGYVDANSAFVKKGSGKMTVSGAWKNTGSVTVREGELHLSNTASLGTGALMVNEGAILSGSVKSLTNSKLTVNGTLQIGATATATIGTFGLNGKDATFAQGSTLDLGINGCTTDKATKCTQLAGIKRLTINGTITAHLASSYNPVAGDSIQIVVAETITGTPRFDLPDLPAGLYWDTADFLATGLLRVTTNVPNGIQAINADSINDDAYDLWGRKVDARTYRGIIVRNGKKIFINN